VQLWRSKLGFKPLAAKELRQLQTAVAPLKFYSEATLLAKPLAKQRKQQKHTPRKQQQRRQQQEEQMAKQATAAEVPVAAAAETAPAVGVQQA
jgi:hypothetical protein